MKQGEILVRLDNTVTRSNLAIVVKGLDELGRARLGSKVSATAEDSVAFPATLLDRAGNADIASILDGERKIVRVEAQSPDRPEGAASQADRATPRGGPRTQAQRESKEKETKLIDREKEGVNELWKQKLVPLTKMTELERQAARLEGKRTTGRADRQTAGKVSETELQILQIDRDLSSEVAKETREIDGKIGEFIERKVAAEDQLKRVEIRAPQDGTVFQSTVHTVGGVINRGRSYHARSSRDADTLTVEARVNPQDINQVKVGQNARLAPVGVQSAHHARNQWHCHPCCRRHRLTSAQALNYYVVRIAMPPEEVAKLGSLKIVPGMPVELFVQTGERTMISYLLKPLSDQATRMFREK